MENIIKSVNYDYAAMMQAVKAIALRYPFVKVSSIGKSVMGKDIVTLSVGRGSEVLYAAAFHGNESITTQISLRFFENLCSAFADNTDIAGVSVQKALSVNRLTVVPRVNPDGCDISLKGSKACGNFASYLGKLCSRNFSRFSANARGVDINHNFDAGWRELRELEKQNGIYGPAAKRYGGEKPESEPETVALTTLCRKIPFRKVLAFHTQGEVIYWDFGGIKVQGAYRQAQRFSELSGYALDVPTGLSFGGGFKDWFIKEFRRPGFTVEFGAGENPLNPLMLDGIYDKTESMLMYALVL